ncbi:MAG: fused response regulator/phosphatase [Magnetococcales bacterium]|nr:fused response regulator/phosphatase [Magnetococcales bacterium]
MKILVVDDDRVNSTLLNRLLGRDGHTVISAFDGQEGIKKFEQERPDLVLMDVRMPRLDGYDAARRIKAVSSDRFVPIIFLTAVTDEEGLARCIDAGGDDFLTKPFNRTILQAKIGAMGRIQQLDAVQRSQKAQLEEQKLQLERHQENVRQELEVGNHLFNGIVRAGSLLDAPCLNHWTSPMSMFNGDLLVASYNPAGGLIIMLGDFTGHGLSAAVGALPLAETFYDMTAQGFSIGELVEGVNAKLLKVMPRRMFCAACILEVDYRQQSLTVWNGGLPDVLIADAEGHLAGRIVSSHLPLGVIPMTREDQKVEILEMKADQRIFVYSDGLIEANGHDQEMFGSERLERIFNGSGAAGLFKSIRIDLETFRDGVEQTDDISLLEIVCDKAGEEPTGGKQTQERDPIPPSAWSASFRYSAETLRSVDPLPTVINVLMKLQAPSGHRERIYTILAELFSNALDHGLLGLDTQMKTTPEGFMRYYSQREERLAKLEDGYINLDLTHTPFGPEDNERHGQGGEIRIRMEDSGPGFNQFKIHSSLEGNMGHGGRGIALIRSLCAKLVYHGRSNIAEAIYHWTF